VQVDEWQFASRALEDNPWGDSATRPVIVLSPEGVPPETPLPAIWMLAGYTGTGRSFLNWTPWEETLSERADRLMALGMPPVRLVLPDAFTALGGSQYLDSPGIGRYATYLWDEVRPAVETRYRTTARGVIGKSSGGYGALLAAMTRPGLFQAVASHAGDMGFEWCYLPDMPKAVAVIRQSGGIEAFWQAFQAAHPKPRPSVDALNILAMAAAYSPPLGAAAGFPAELPVDDETLAVKPAVWARWLRHDPVFMVEAAPYREALKRLRLLYLDAGDADEFHLQYGARRLSERLRAYGILHRCEIFAGSHFGMNHRYDVSLPAVAAVLAAAEEASE
jgi:hypothetical protein